MEKDAIKIHDKIGSFIYPIICVPIIGPTDQPVTEIIPKNPIYLPYVVREEMFTIADWTKGSTIVSATEIRKIIIINSQILFNKPTRE